MRFVGTLGTCRLTKVLPTTKLLPRTFNRARLRGPLGSPPRRKAQGNAHIFGWPAEVSDQPRSCWSSFHAVTSPTAYPSQELLGLLLDLFASPTTLIHHTCLCVCKRRPQLCGVGVPWRPPYRETTARRPAASIFRLLSECLCGRRDASGKRHRHPQTTGSLENSWHDPHVRRYAAGE